MVQEFKVMVIQFLMLIFLMKGKLTYTDDVFPIVAALSSMGYKHKIRLIYPSFLDLKTIMSNKEYYSILNINKN